MPFSRNLQLSILDILFMRKGAFVSDIKAELIVRLDKEYSLGAILTTLDRLKEKELVSFDKSPSLSVRGGKRRRLYYITLQGKNTVSDYFNSFESCREIILTS